MTAQRSWLTVVVDLLTFRRMPIWRRFTLFTLGVSGWFLVIGFAGIRHQPDWRSVASILAAIVVAHILLIAFAWNAARSFTGPIHAINTQVRDITSGELTELGHIHVSSDDEVGELTTRINGLLDALRELNVFKQVIERDECAEDVYGRLEQVFRAKELPDHHVLVLDSQRRGLRVLREDGGRSCACAEVLADGAARCRAFRTASAASSDSFRGVCKLFDREGYDHHCIPLIIGGTAGGVVQFVRGGDNAPTKSAFQLRIEVAGRFVREALPVLEARRLTDTLRGNACRDALTQLYNRRYLDESIGPMTALARRRGLKLGVVLCDVDHFKKVNDEHGHAAGDEVLKEVAAALLATVRESDVVVRYGGEEFLVLLHDTDSEGAARVAERMRAAVQAREVTAQAAVLRVTMSFGVAELPGDAASFSEVVQLADAAMYKAKAAGRNRVIAHAAARRSDAIEAEVPSQSGRVDGTRFDHRPPPARPRNAA